MSTLHEGRKYLPEVVKAKLQEIVNVVMGKNPMVTVNREYVTNVVECAAVAALSLSGKLDTEEYKPGKWMQD